MKKEQIIILEKYEELKHLIQAKKLKIGDFVNAVI